MTTSFVQMRKLRLREWKAFTQIVLKPRIGGDKHDEALEHPMSPSGLSSNSTPHLLLKSEMSQIWSVLITRLSGSEQA